MPCTASAATMRRSNNIEKHSNSTNDASVCEALGNAHERNGEYREAVEQWTRAMLLANDTELVPTLRAAKTKENVDSAVRGVAAKRLDRLLRNRERGDYVPAIRFAPAFAGRSSGRSA